MVKYIHQKNIDLNHFIQIMPQIAGTAIQGRTCYNVYEDCFFSPFPNYYSGKFKAK